MVLTRTRRPSGPYRALDLLIREHPPKFKGKVPYWRPPVAGLDDVHARIIPAWSWSRRVSDLDGERVLQLDANAAYLSAIMTVEVSHGPLGGSSRQFDPRIPGYWLVDAHSWKLSDRIMSPLGMARTTDRVWLTTPTVQLLQQLSDQGVWPGVRVYGAFIGSSACRLRGWASRIASDRSFAMQAGDDSRVAEIKLGYSQAVTLLGTDKKSDAFRPDWADFIRAQHAATIWRKAWGMEHCNLGWLLRSGAVDELIYPETAIRTLLDRAARGDRVPLTIDPSGRTLGSFKIKGQWSTKSFTRTRGGQSAAAAPVSRETETT